MTGLKSLEPFAPFWRDEQLHLAVRSTGESTGPAHNIVIGRSTLNVAGTVIPHHRVDRITLEPSLPQGWQIWVYTITETFERRDQVTLAARSQPVGPLHEIVRVLRCWRDDPGLRDAWGSAEAEALLLPDLEGELLEKMHAEPTLSGLTFPCTPAADPLQPQAIGLILFLIVAAVFLVAPVLILPVWIALAVVGGVGWGIRRAVRPRPAHLLVTQHALILSGGTTLSFDGIDSIHGTPTGLAVNAAGVSHIVSGLHGHGVALAAALSARITEPGSAPASLDAIRNRSVDSPHRDTRSSPQDNARS